MKTLNAAALIALLLLAPALAAQSLNSLLDDAAAVAPGDHEAWITARDRIVAMGNEIVPQLNAAGAAENWTAEGWLRAMVAQACRLRITSPNIAAIVDYPRGINPEYYGLLRRPMPIPQRDLIRLGAESTPLLLERLRWTMDNHAYSTGPAGEAERDALGQALLYAPGYFKDARARFALEAALKDPALPDEWRQEAAVSLGKVGGRDALKPLGDIIDAAAQPVTVREAAAWALGRVADDDAALALQNRLHNQELIAGPHGDRLVLALLNGVGILGNRLAWQARGDAELANGLRIRTQCARMLVDALVLFPQHAAFISTQLRAVALEASLDWVKELADAGENEAVRKAAALCVEPLRLTLSRFE